MEKMFYSAKDLTELVGCSKSRAYKLIRDWNAELESKGYTVAIAGKVLKKYADLKMGFDMKNKEEICNV